MIGFRDLPAQYLDWNRRWGVPNGRTRYRWLPFHSSSFVTKLLGPFAWQCNSSTRIFEYPWIYDKISKLGMDTTIVELGGSLAGMQFVLASEGRRVINIDPGMNASGKGWNLDLAEHKRLSRVFQAPVEVIPTTLDHANIPNASVDIVLSISALEHFSEADIEHAAHHIPRILKPGGVMIFTVDLFLDLMPFTSQLSNKWGRNLDVAKFLDESRLVLCEGHESELLGYPSFSPAAITSKIDKYMYESGGPCVPQCVVAKLRD